MHGQIMAESLKGEMRFAAVGRRATHDVAIDITASGQRAQLDLVDAMNGLPKIPFDDAVQLYGLAGRQFHGRIADLITEIEVGQELGSSQNAARNPGPNHITMRSSTLGSLTRNTLLTVVLLIRSVKFEKLRIVFREVIGLGAQCFGNRSPKIVTGFLDSFDRAKFGSIRHILFGVRA